MGYSTRCCDRQALLDTIMGRPSNHDSINDREVISKP